MALITKEWIANFITNLCGIAMLLAVTYDIIIDNEYSVERAFGLTALAIILLAVFDVNSAKRYFDLIFKKKIDNQ